MAYSVLAGTASPYTYTYSATALGASVEGMGIEPIIHRDDIRIDDFADTVIDGVYRGYNLMLTLRLAEWNATGRDKILYQMCGTAGSTPGTLDNIGKLIVAGSMALQLIATPIISATGNYTYTFKNCFPDTNSGGFQLNSRLRIATVRLMVFPDITAATPTLFTKA